MKISEKRYTALYNAIHAPIMDLRVKVAMGEANIGDIDKLLFDLQIVIPEEVDKALGLTKT